MVEVMKMSIEVSLSSQETTFLPINLLGYVVNVAIKTFYLLFLY